MTALRDKMPDMKGEANICIIGGPEEEKTGRTLMSIIKESYHEIKEDLNLETEGGLPCTRKKVIKNQ